VFWPNEWDRDARLNFGVYLQFALDDAEVMIGEAARRLARERLAPLADRLDLGQGRQEFLSNLKLLAQNGFMTLNCSGDYGGAQAGSVAFALAIEEFAYACAATATTVSVTNLVAELIQSIGTSTQKSRYIPRISSGEYAAAAFCLTEAGAGSDPASMRTRARPEDNGYILDGEKLYISNGEYAGVLVVWAVTDPTQPKGKGISCFLVEPQTAGLTIGTAESKMGQTGSATNSVTFDRCRIDAAALMGTENDGFRIAVRELAGGRIGIAALSLGIARAAMDKAKEFVKQRRQFGQAIAAFQGIQWMIADRETDIEAARLLILSAAVKRDRGEAFGKEASMAKLFASEAAHRATDTAIQLYGGAGYIRGNIVERLARDARITRIYEGTSEIQRLIIARDVLG
jgi:alkylation response protein AidB-like acyl-CoA dehydrogenase